MKNLNILAVTLGVIVPTALLLSFRSHVTTEGILGYFSVLTLLGVAAVEYGVSGKRLLGR